MTAQAGLMTLSRAALDRLARDTDAGTLLRHEGQLALYDSAASFRASLPGWEARRAAGVRFDLLTDPGAIAAIQPGLSPRFSHAGFTPDWINTVDPALWVAHLAGVLVARGGRIERAAIAAIEPGADRVRLVAEAGAVGPELAARQVVLAAGAWSRPLLRGIGPDLPLETERGYNTTLPAGAFDLRTHVTFADHGFVVSRIGAGVRVGGAVELGGLRLPPNHARARVLLDKAAAFLPGLDRRGGTQWMGFRPSMPDSLPVIGRAPGAARVILAFGHGHLGLTQSAGTAELIADIACDRPPALDLAPFAPMRFTRRG